ncbi:MAG: hypothetical protein WD535_03735, partial [Thermaerobacterales bacterium]
MLEPVWKFIQRGPHKGGTGTGHQITAGPVAVFDQRAPGRTFGKKRRIVHVVVNFAPGKWAPPSGEAIFLASDALCLEPPKGD